MKWVIAMLFVGTAGVACDSTGDSKEGDTQAGDSHNGSGDGDADSDGDGDTDTDSDGDTDTDTDSDSGSDTGDLWPGAWSVLSTSCGGPNSCHNRSSGGSGGLSLPSDDEGICKINATAAASSIRSSVSSGQMPEGSTLTTEERARVIDWIDSL